MTAMDYYIKRIGFNQVDWDSSGNCYIYDGEESSNVLHRRSLTHYKRDGYLFLDTETVAHLRSYHVELPEVLWDFESSARRPYYRMRGKPVTEAQAFEIIRRTDSFFCYGNNYEQLARSDRYIESIHFQNWLIGEYHYPCGYGWIHTDGTVGLNSITQRYPTAAEFVDEWLELIMAFPFLDLAIAVTWWNEDFKNEEQSLPGNDFFDAVEIGIRVHNNTVEILESEQAVEVYRKYAEKYEDANQEKYRPDYYQTHKIIQVDDDYLKRCMECYEFD